MSDTEQGETNDKPFYVDCAKGSRAGCKKCKQKIESGTLRIAKFVANPFGDGKVKHWYHVNCIFEAFTRQRATTIKIQSTDDIDGWLDNLSHDDRNTLIKQFPDYVTVESNPTTGPTIQPKTPRKRKPKGDGADSPGPTTSAVSLSSANFSQSQAVSGNDGKESKDNLFREFRRLCADVANESSYLNKTEIIRKLFTKGSDGNGFKGDIILWCRMLLPGVVKRVYNLQSKQLIKLFSKMFGTDQDEMLEDLEQGDIGETIKVFFEHSTKLKPAKKSLLTLKEVDEFLEHLSTLTKEEEQMDHFKPFCALCTSNDLKMVIRLIKGDLRINAGAKPILNAIHEDAYSAFQATQDLEFVIKDAMKLNTTNTSVFSPKKKMNITISLLTPVLPMLAEACKSVEQAMKKCPNGMYSEIKYDGERVQVHKEGNEFKYFSRSLKPVLDHKVKHFKDYIPQAFPHGKDLILDSEVLMIDLKTGKPLPFGSLGKYKRNEYDDANVCLFVFDCLYYNGESLLGKPIKERKKILQENMIEVPNHIVFSEMEEIHDPKDLENMISKVLKLGLEGLVLKDLMSLYEPGKRHWLKVKKDYLFGGKMADTADLVVLGAWYGTGQKGGMMSIFLMGCRDPDKNVWYTVTKVHTGHDDKTLDRLQTELADNMVKISKDPSKVPSWLKCTKTMIPDFVAIDPKLQPVWEITGAEFTQHEVHTADGISIRFPRVTRIRNDKNWETATTLPELQNLYENSKHKFDGNLFGSSAAGDNSNHTTPVNSDDESNDVGETTKSPKQSTVSLNPFKDSSTKKEKTKTTSPSSKTTSKASKTPSPSKVSTKKRKADSTDVPEPKPTLSPLKGAADLSLSANKKKRSETTQSETESPTLKKRKIDFDFKDGKDKYLVDVFEGVRMELNKEEVPDYDTVYRYFIAYGGEVISSGKSTKKPTHVIKTRLNKATGLSVPLVELSWIWDSIKLQKLQDPLLYLA